MSSDGEITRWLRQLKEGDRSATQELWQRYFARLVALARQRLRGAPRRAADEEDVALSAFDSFCRSAEDGRFPRLDDRDDLWQVLVLITVRKAADQATRERRQKRGGGLTVPAADLADEGVTAFAGLLSREPDPALAAQVAEGCRRLLDALGDGVLRAVAVAKMEGQSNEDIARRLNLSVSSVERKLRGCREILRTCLLE
jgi:DNA-directed RNA polymerase specialized sigma24 family protein